MKEVLSCPLQDGMWQKEGVSALQPEINCEVSLASDLWLECGAFGEKRKLGKTCLALLKAEERDSSCLRLFPLCL